MTSLLYLKQMELGPMQNYVYLVGDPSTKECVAVDPAWEIDTIVETAEHDEMTIIGALITHTHPDHVGGRIFGMDIPGVESFLERVSVKVYVNKAEGEFMKGYGSDLVRVDGGTELRVGRMTITLLHTPGHTPGSQCFLIDGRLISGDTLFIGGCGRTDLPGGDPEALYLSLTERLGRLPDETLLLPGHNYGGSSSTIGDEKRGNPYMRFGSVGDFLRAMGGGRIVIP
jgi:glyoxylase-like metal-dependent hydrolase (beta-lactamase superfamily II)